MGKMKNDSFYYFQKCWKNFEFPGFQKLKINVQKNSLVGVLLKKILFSKIVQNSLKNTCDEVSLLIKLQVFSQKLYLKSLLHKCFTMSYAKSSRISSYRTTLCYCFWNKGLQNFLIKTKQYIVTMHIKNLLDIYLYINAMEKLLQRNLKAQDFLL